MKHDEDRSVSYLRVDLAYISKYVRLWPVGAVFILYIFISLRWQQAITMPKATYVSWLWDGGMAPAKFD